MLLAIEKYRIIEMTRKNRTTFNALTVQFDLKEHDVIGVIRRMLKLNRFKLWIKPGCNTGK